MLEVLGAVLIIILVAVEAVCSLLVVKYLHDRSERRTTERRAFYRHRAYKEMNERCDLKKSREMLWNMISK